MRLLRSKGLSYATSATIQYVGVDHRRVYVTVPKQLPDRADGQRLLARVGGATPESAVLVDSGRLCGGDLCAQRSLFVTQDGLVLSARKPGSASNAVGRDRSELASCSFPTAVVNTAERKR